MPSSSSEEPFVPLRKLLFSRLVIKSGVMGACIMAFGQGTGTKWGMLPTTKSGNFMG
ncbi:hypothetical protein CLU79DRAFT_758541 [Phycomyces nitens]|nr:hypothetical protein CLU79DRAFT_758541 [Phycomyces nitens]